MTESKPIIQVSHVTIRESISFLLLRLVVLDIFAAVFAILFFWGVSTTTVSDVARLNIISFNYIYFFILALLKIGFVIYVVLQWTNEYYEIFPNKITYRTGLIWKRETHFSFDEIVSMGIQQGVFGKIFNYGTITMYDYRERKLAVLYLIHNPMKYFKVLESLLPNLDKEKHIIREHILEEEEE